MATYRGEKIPTCYATVSQSTYGRRLHYRAAHRNEFGGIERVSTLIDADICMSSAQLVTAMSMTYLPN